MSIEPTPLEHGRLEGEVAVVPVAGRGIGFEGVRALVWLGAKVKKNTSITDGWTKEIDNLLSEL